MWETTKSVKADIKKVLFDIREADKKELSYFKELGLKAKIKKMVELGSTSLFIDGDLVCIYGVKEHKQAYLPYMITTEHIIKHKISFLKVSKPLFKKLLEECDKDYLIHNFVHYENILAIKWLRWVGFSFGRSRYFNGTYFFEFSYV